MILSHEWLLIAFANRNPTGAVWITLLASHWAAVARDRRSRVGIRLFISNTDSVRQRVLRKTLENQEAFRLLNSSTRFYFIFCWFHCIAFGHQADLTIRAMAEFLAVEAISA